MFATENATMMKAPAFKAESMSGETLTEAVYNALRSDIISGKRPPDERLRIEHISKLYQVGPTPLREALQRLCADGLVISQGNRGFSVVPLDPREFADLNIARAAIEKEAIRLSIARGDDAWEAGIVAAAYRLAKEDAALQSSPGLVLDSWERANAVFHLAIVADCGSNSLLAIRKGLHDKCERFRRASVAIRSVARDLDAEHKAIAAAALAHNAERVCRLTELHFEVTTQTLLDEALSGP